MLFVIDHRPQRPSDNIRKEQCAGLSPAQTVFREDGANWEGGGGCILQVLFLVFVHRRALCWCSAGTVIVVFVFIRAGDNGAAAMLVLSFFCGLDCWNGERCDGVSRGCRERMQQRQTRRYIWREGADVDTLERQREGRTSGQKCLWLRLTVSWNTAWARTEARRTEDRQLAVKMAGDVRCQPRSFKQRHSRERRQLSALRP